MTNIYICPSCQHPQNIDFKDDEYTHPCSKCGGEITQYIDMQKPQEHQAIDLSIEEPILDSAAMKKIMKYSGYVLGVIGLVAAAVFLLKPSHTTEATDVSHLALNLQSERPQFTTGELAITQSADTVTVQFELSSNVPTDYPAINLYACLENPCNKRVARTWVFAKNQYKHDAEQLTTQSVSLSIPLKEVPTTTASLAVEALDNPIKLNSKD